jgi:hypothetical protein
MRCNSVLSIMIYTVVPASFQQKQFLSKFYYYNISWIVNEWHRKIERKTLYMFIKNENLHHYYWLRNIEKFLVCYIYGFQ